MNNYAMAGRKSSHEGSVGRHEGSCCTESEAYVAGTGSVGATGAGGVISSEEVSAAIGGRRSYGNGGITRSPNLSRRYIQKSYGSDDLILSIFFIIL